MSRFRIEVENVEREATNMDSICKDMKQIGESVKNISNHLSISGASADTIKAKLLKMQDEIISNAVKVNTLQGALREVAANYLNAEKQVVGEGQYSIWEAAQNILSQGAKYLGISSVIDGIRKKLKDAIQKIKEAITGRKSTVTAEQEKAHDEYMMSEISKIQKKYADQWSKASASKREKLLKEYMNEVCKIMGISVNTLKWTEQKPSNGYITLGYYSSASNGVWVNKYAIANYDSSILTTMTHELRHAYQHQAIKNPSKFKITEETAKEWKNSFNNYMSMDGFKRKYKVSDAEAYQMYRDQAVERDARSFAGQN